MMREVARSLFVHESSPDAGVGLLCVLQQPVSGKQSDDMTEGSVTNEFRHGDEQHDDRV